MEHFATTQWSLVVDAAHELTPLGREALATLCERYWYPLYAYLRRSGHDASAAEDLTQGFFTHLLESHALRVADPMRGRFRSFLLASLNNFVSNVRAHERAQKRGGAVAPFPLDVAVAEERYQHQPIDGWTPETVFERNWALMLLERALRGLETEYQALGKAELFTRLSPYVTGQGDDTYAAVGTGTGISEGAVRVAVHRLRRRYRELLHEEIAHTVSTRDDIDGELRYLITVLKRHHA
jgi:RNA polymerase sigma factor (sigma-70 family)